MPRPKRTKAPPRRVWVLFNPETLDPVGVTLTEDEAAENLGADEVAYRYDFHIPKG